MEIRYLTKEEDSFINSFVEYLRWSEGFMMDSAVSRHHIGDGREGPLDHVVIPLMWRFKGETGSRNHLQAVLNKAT